MNVIKTKNEFYTKLTNRTIHQGNGKYTAREFRKKYLSALDSKDIWNDLSEFITFDFDGVRKISPSFANEAFGYFMKYISPDKFKKKVLFINISRIQKLIIDEELRAGYYYN